MTCQPAHFATGCSRVRWAEEDHEAPLTGTRSVWDPSLGPRKEGPPSLFLAARRTGSSATSHVHWHVRWHGWLGEGHPMAWSSVLLTAGSTGWSIRAPEPSNQPSEGLSTSAPTTLIPLPGRGCSVKLGRAVCMPSQADTCGRTSTQIHTSFKPGRSLGHGGEMGKGVLLYHYSVGYSHLGEQQDQKSWTVIPVWSLRARAWRQLTGCNCHNTTSIN
jgi:hypothetical protein